MTEPRTEAGRRLLPFWEYIGEDELRDAILAIEAEAAGLSDDALMAALDRGAYWNERALAAEAAAALDVK
jgi:hypothetical protein